MAHDRQPDDLDARIAQARAGRSASGADRGPAKGYAQGSRILAELIGAPLGGALIGGLLDHWLGTGHWLLLILLVLGFVVACRNVYRISRERSE